MNNALSGSILAPNITRTLLACSHTGSLVHDLCKLEKRVLPDEIALHFTGENGALSGDIRVHFDFV
jgi:hypothetical protein